MTEQQKAFKDLLERCKREELEVIIYTDREGPFTGFVTRVPVKSIDDVVHLTTQLGDDSNGSYVIFYRIRAVQYGVAEELPEEK